MQYGSELKTLSSEEKSSVPSIPRPMPLSHVWHQFIIRTANRDKVQHYLEENGIQTMTGCL